MFKEFMHSMSILDFIIFNSYVVALINLGICFHNLLNEFYSWLDKKKNG